MSTQSGLTLKLNASRSRQLGSSRRRSRLWEGRRGRWGRSRGTGAGIIGLSGRMIAGGTQLGSVACPVYNVTRRAIAAIIRCRSAITHRADAAAAAAGMQSGRLKASLTSALHFLISADNGP